MDAAIHELPMPPAALEAATLRGGACTAGQAGFAGVSPSSCAQERHLQRLSRAGRFIGLACNALWALHKGDGALWRPRPKVHLLMELLELSVRWHGRNPRVFMCYLDEDAMRHVARVGGSCHMRSVSTAAIQKVLLRLTVRWAQSMSSVPSGSAWLS